uniref:Tc1-like transposase DDE domain-containing protein n=1 Tax=Oncorhynchus tshawytscha TaxID=74940 RepID=A0AAZ3S0K8_ONCTS
MKVLLQFQLHIEPQPENGFITGTLLFCCSHLLLIWAMTQHTYRLCKGYYLTKKESDGVLHQMTWPPQSSNLNPIEMVWDELDQVKEKQPTSAQHMWELLQDCWKSIPVILFVKSTSIFVSSPALTLACPDPEPARLTTLPRRPISLPRLWIPDPCLT